jgi:malonate decarboxylase beta subunit
MSAASVARVTKRTQQEVTELEKLVPAVARDVHSFASLGGIDRIVSCNSADSPDGESIASIRKELQNGFKALRQVPREPNDRLDSTSAINSRRMSHLVRAKLEEEWD